METKAVMNLVRITDAAAYSPRAVSAANHTCAVSNMALRRRQQQQQQQPLHRCDAAAIIRCPWDRLPFYERRRLDSGYD